MNFRQLNQDVWLFVGDEYESAATAFVNGNDVLLVDTLASTDDAIWMREVIEEMGKKVRIIVATHYMSDHLAGLRMFPDAVSIAHRHYLHTFLSQNTRLDEFFVEPNVTFDGQMNLNWGRHEIRLIHNPGKTMDHVAVDVPEDDLVCAGDNIVGNIVYLSKADPRQIDRAIERLQQLGRKWVVSAHMGLFPASVLANARSYLARLREHAIGARRSHSGESLDIRIAQIRIEDCISPGIVASEFEREWHQNNLALIRDQAIFELDAFQESLVSHSRV